MLHSVIIKSVSAVFMFISASILALLYNISHSSQHWLFLQWQSVFFAVAMF